MNRITKFVNRVNKALDPLAELAKDENFRGEVLASVGAKEKTTPEGKAKTKEKLNKLLELLDTLRKKLGLDKTDIPNVDNIVALGMYLVECYAVTKAFREFLESCDFEGAENEGPDKETAIVNAVRAMAKYLTQNILKKEAPAFAAWGEAAGIFSDEYNETKRALDLVLFPLIATFNKLFSTELNTDIFRPTGDFKADDHLRTTKGYFLILSVLSVALEGLIKPGGRFLFNFGYELPPDQDAFPLAGKIAGRVMQMQFIPGAYYLPDRDEWVGDELFGAVFRDSVVSFATIPVFPPNAAPDAAPLGFQYLLGLELNPGPTGNTGEEPGTKASRFSFSIPANFTGNLIWGHAINFTAFNSDPFGSGPLLVARLEGTKPVNGEKADGINNGDISFSIEPKKINVNGQPKDDAEFSLSIHDFTLTLSGEGRDGFIQKILPESAAATINASLSLTYSALLNKWTVKGLDGNEGLLLLFKIEKSLFGKLEIPTVYVGLKPSMKEENELNGIMLEASALMKLILGPFSMTVDRLGLYTKLDFPENGEGNLLGANLDVGLKPPSGIGFLVKASVVKGGGFLSFDPDNHQYYGAGELTIEFNAKTPDKFGLSLKVVAIILTRMPDGSKGFSFLLLATVEFSPPLDTVFGFKLKGLGVLVALNRSMNLDVMQEAVRDDRFNSILFPDNPVGNAPTIVKTMNALFPPARDRYVFAIMARIGWGSAKLVDIKAGLLIEVPSPIKLALAGVIKVTIEEGGVKILRFQLNFLVALDFGKKMLSIDAAIYDSKFLVFDIRGQMFLRYRWGADPVFLFSVGGWHPDFQVPSGLNLPAKPQRITVPLMESDNPSLVLSCYVAFTSNTVQAGFAIDFKMKWSKFRLEAGLSVDALFHFDPFYFIVDFEGKLRIFWGSSRLAGVTVKGEFSGTHPWRIRGKATFEIWIWDYDVDFDKSSGSKLSEISQEVEVLPLVQKAVQDKENWQVSMPAGHSSHVQMRNTEEDLAATPEGQQATTVILADPLSQLEVMQQVTPLGIRIDKLGFQRVRDFRKYDLAVVNATGQTVEGRDLTDFFAAGMFLEMNDAEKLSRKSYEPMKAGRSFGDTESVSTGTARITTFEYDNDYYDPLAPVEKPEAPAVSTDNFQIWIRNNSVARSAEGRTYVARKEVEARRSIINESAFVLADVVSGNQIAEVPGQKSMTGAYYELWKFQRANPLRKVQVVRESELVP